MTTCQKGVTENEKEKKEKEKETGENAARRTSISARWKLRSFGELSGVSLMFLTRCIPGWSTRSFSDEILQGPEGSAEARRLEGGNGAKTALSAGSRAAKSEVTKKGRDGFIKLNVSPTDKIFPRSRGPWENLVDWLAHPRGAPRKGLTVADRTRPFRVRFPPLALGLPPRG